MLVFLHCFAVLISCGFAFLLFAALLLCCLAVHCLVVLLSYVGAVHLPLLLDRVLRVRAADGGYVRDDRELVEPGDVVRPCDRLQGQGHLHWSPFEAHRHRRRQAEDPRRRRGRARENVSELPMSLVTELQHG